MKHLTLWLILGFLLLSNSACMTQILTEKPQPTIEPTLETVPPSLDTLAPPLADVEFSEDVKPYPTNWNTDFIFQEIFKPIEFSQSTLPGGNKLSWSIKLRFEGTIQNAADDLRTFLATKGWKVVDETDLDTGGKLWIIEKEGGGSGIIIIDAQEEGRTVIIGTFND